MVADALSSSEAFIRAIKSSSDPPIEGGLTKIELATEAVSRTSLYIPAKHEIVAEWILSRLFKDRKAEKHSSAALDARYWKLLAQVVVGDNSSQSKLASTWLQPLLLKYPLLLLVSAVVRNAPSVSENLLQECQNVLRVVSSSVSVKFTYDSAWELFVDTISVIAEDTKNGGEKTSSWLWTSAAQNLTTSAISLCGDVLTESTHKKKTVNAFVTGPICTWLNAQSALQNPPPSSSSSSSTASTLFSVVSTFMFSPDTLRQQLPFWSSTTKNTNESSTSTPSHLNRIFGEGDMISVLEIVPSIFKSFVVAVQTHRSSLFSQQLGSERVSPKVRAKRASVEFLQACLASVESRMDGFDEKGWKCISQLLQVAEEENLVASDNADARSALINLGKQAVSLLRISGVKAETLLEVLITLIRMDFSFIESHLGELFSTLAVLSPTPLTRTLLTLHTTYHVKTRTLHALISLLIQTFVHVHPPPPNYDFPSSFHALLLKSSLSDHAYADELSISISKFLTPSQVAGVVGEIVGAATKLFETIVVASTQPQSKKRKLSKSVEKNLGSDPDLDIVSARLSAILRLSSIVLRSVPLQIIAAESLASVKQHTSTLYSDVLRRAIDLALSSASSNLSASNQMLAAAALRVSYALQGMALFDVNTGEDALKERGEVLALLIKSTNLSAELRVELVRTGLQHLSKQDITTPLLQQSPNMLFESLKVAMTFPDLKETLAWDGSLSALDTSAMGKTYGYAAIWEVVVDRWLDVIDEHAPQDLLQLIAKVIIRSATSSAFTSHTTHTATAAAAAIHTPYSMCRQALASARLWELPNIKPILLRTLSQGTDALASLSLSDLLEHDIEPPPIEDGILTEAARCLQFVMKVPTEYLDKTSRSILAHRALVADVCLTLSSITNEERIRSHILLRTLLLRITVETGNVELLFSSPKLPGYLITHKFLTEGGPTDDESQALELVTLEIMNLAHSAATKSIQGNLRTLLTAYSNELGSAGTITLCDRCAVQLLEALADARESDKMPDDLLSQVRTIYTHVSSSTSGALSDISFETSEDVNSALRVLEVFRQLNRTGRWLEADDFVSSSVLHHLLRKLVSQAQAPSCIPSPALCSSVLRTLLQNLSEALRNIEDIEVAMAACIVVAGLLSPSTWKTLDPVIAQSFKSLEKEEFSHALVILHDMAATDHGAVIQSESQTQGETRITRTVIALYISSVMIRNSPEGCFKVNQEYATRIFQRLATLDWTYRVGMSNTLLTGLEIVLDLIGDKSATLRNADTAAIYSLLSAVVSGSGSHEVSTSNRLSSNTIYETTVSILMTLIRLRRDLVSHTLPHLVAILNRLFEILRCPRPELGARQQRSVADTLPWWINPNLSSTLSSDCAKVLARLLTNLKTKTAVRSAGAGDIPSSLTSAQSLAQPFSKHAPYVVTSYIRALIDPLSVISPSIRRELEPGLFALCDIMGEYGRDAIMTAMLDDAGKAMMKVLWMEYDKQRYVGKG